MSGQGGRHRAPGFDSARALWGVLALTVGALLIALSLLDVAPQLNALGFAMGGALIGSALYEFTNE